MINRFKVIPLLAIMLVMSSVAVFGTTNGINITYNTNDDTDIKAAVAAAAQAVTGKDATSVHIKTQNAKKADGTSGKGDVEIMSYASGVLTFDPIAFKDAKPKEAKKAMVAFMDALKESSISSDTQSDIMAQIQESDPDVANMMIPIIMDSTKADMFTAYKWLYPILVVLRIVFGIGATVLIFMTVGSTIIDLAYIGLPVWRENSEEKGKKHPAGVSYEALKVVIETEKNIMDGAYKNAYFVYLKRRATAYIFLSLCILYLIAGELGGLVQAVLNMFSGVV